MKGELLLLLSALQKSVINIDQIMKIERPNSGSRNNEKPSSSLKSL
jgi:hypothetical protein